ncbi:MAG TPA: hypothetical protein PLX35_16775 [Cyclobacteriaceae bacterium]|nr:hypothetical protein [Cyclobacteriaceae bacterium]
MNCEKIRPLIELYDILGESERDSVDRHVQSCTACKAVMQSAHAFRSQVISTRSVSVSLPHAAQFTGDVMASIQPAPRSGFSFWFAIRWSATVASMVLIGLLAFEWMDAPAAQIHTPVAGGIVLSRTTFAASLQQRTPHTMTDCADPLQRRLDPVCIRQHFHNLK